MLRHTSLLLSLLLPLLLPACQEYDLVVTSDDLGIPQDCELDDIYPEDQVPVETCPQVPGTFVPIVEWDAGQGQSCWSVPAVADLDGDGLPEVIANFVTGIINAPGEIVVLDGTGTVKWRAAASLGYASGLSIGDLDRDGTPEIYGVRAFGNQLPTSPNEYAVVSYDSTGNERWVSDKYTGKDFDYATGLVLSDMDHDGRVEIVAGRVILNDDGSLRGKGEYGRGSWGEMPFIGGGTISEATVPAVADIDLDGVEEVLTGNTFYTPDGEVKWHSETQADGMVAVTNLDADPEAELIVSSFATVRAIDTNGAILWGPKTLTNANIVSPAAVADLDGDGMVEIVVAGGNQLVALNHDGTELWSQTVIDESGATGASIFDFESDGNLDVVYIDEENMTVYDGRTGAVKFFNPDHASNTMMDYPVISDVDADGQAEIVVAHAGFGKALSVYGDQDESWGPARRVWNQHAYSIANVDDDLTIPQNPVQGFTTHRTWHSALDTRLLDDYPFEVTAEIIDTCEVDCEQDTFYLVGRVVNRSDGTLPEGIPVALYALRQNGAVLIDVQRTDRVTEAGTTSRPFAFEVPATSVTGASALRLVADDSGSGLGMLIECDEFDNAAEIAGPFCP